jgi:hypothetical protein
MRRGFLLQIIFSRLSVVFAKCKTDKSGHYQDGSGYHSQCGYCIAGPPGRSLTSSPRARARSGAGLRSMNPAGSILLGRPAGPGRAVWRRSAPPINDLATAAKAFKAAPSQADSPMRWSGSAGARQPANPRLTSGLPGVVAGHRAGGAQSTAASASLSHSAAISLRMARDWRSAVAFAS